MPGRLPKSDPCTRARSDCDTLVAIQSYNGSSPPPPYQPRDCFEENPRTSNRDDHLIHAIDGNDLESTHTFRGSCKSLVSFRRRRLRLVVCIALCALSSCSLYYSRTYSAEPRRRLNKLNSYPHIDPHNGFEPEECRSLDFKDPGWAFHHTGLRKTGSTTARVVSGPEVQSSRGQPVLKMLQSQKRMSQACADEWISKGQICQDVQRAQNILKETPVDVVWTFLDDSPHWSRWKDAYIDAGDMDSRDQGTRTKNFRSHNQLLYSVRSVLRNMPFLRRGTILATSLEAVPPHLSGVGATVAHNTACRVMQTPLWLNMSVSEAFNSRLKLLAHWNYFKSHLVPDLNAWRNKVLPVFNSHAIESQFMNLKNPAEHLVYLNDDFYVGRVSVVDLCYELPTLTASRLQLLSNSDFASPLYGPVFRLAINKWMSGATGRELAKFDPENRDRVSRRTIALIDERFGTRNRGWLMHVAYSMSEPMLQEVASVWSEELKETAETTFRGRGNEVYLPLLATFYTMEKHREALLWSFFMARSDLDASGTYSVTEKQAMLQSLSPNNKTETKLVFHFPERPSAFGTYLDRFMEAGLEPPLETNYKWSSRDGYPYPGRPNIINYELDGRARVFCGMPIARCFGSKDWFEMEDSVSAEWTFKNMAFNNTRCGDCIAAALVRASGEAGLEKFLPESDHVYNSNVKMEGASAKHVPYVGDLAKSWEEIDFSLQHILGDKWKPREFAVRLIQRYSYVIGESHLLFDKLTGDNARARKLLSKIKNKPPAFFAINDSLPDDADEEAVEQFRRTLEEWHESMWPETTAYELRSSPALG